MGSSLFSLVVALEVVGVGYVAGLKVSADVEARVMANRLGVLELAVFAAVWGASGLLLPDGAASLALIGIARTLTTGGYLLGWALGHR